MPSTKELRSRIKSVKNMSKATKAMELVSAAKMRRAQDQAIKGRPYSELINNLLKNIAGQIDEKAHPLLVGKKQGVPAALLISTNRGLCGALNTNLFRKSLDLDPETVFVTVGRKGEMFVSRTAKSLVADFELQERPNLEGARVLSKYLIDGFLAGEFSKVSVIYSQFQSTLKQEAVAETLLPIIRKETLEELKEEAKGKVETEYLFEPNADQVLETILPHYIEMELYQILLEGAASEHSARMVAMKNASDNAAELVEELTLDYNQVRQAAITNELLDITTASLALE